MSDHTAGKVKYDSSCEHYRKPCLRINGIIIAEPRFGCGVTVKEGVANANRLALCWNSHDALRAALEWCTKMLEKDKIGLSTEERHALQAAYNVLDKLKGNK